MSNLIFSGGMTVSGGMSAEMGAGSPGLLATSLAFKGFGGAAPSLGSGTANPNSLSYSVSGGVMSLSYDLLFLGTGTQTTAYYGISMPSDYKFCAAYSNGNTIGSGTLGNSNGDYAVEVRYVDPTTIGIYFPSFGQYWNNNCGGFVFGGRLKLTFTMSAQVIPA